MNDHGVLLLAIGFSVLASLAGAWLVLQLLYTRVMLKTEQSRSQLLFLHLGETQAALQTALGGGWQLADPARDIYFLPEEMVLEYRDETTGGKRELTRRDATVTILQDHELMFRIANAYARGIPVAFRGLEWQITGGASNMTCIIGVGSGEHSHELKLVTYASRKG